MPSINPNPVPDTMHPYVRFLVRAGGLALDGEVWDAIAHHLDKVGFVHLGDDQVRHEVTINIGLPGREALIVSEPGAQVDWAVPDGGLSHCRVEGQLPPGVELVGDRLVGSSAIPGYWTVSVIVGPAIKFDSLGNGGAPLEPGKWIPWGEPLEVVPRGAAGVDLTGLCREDLDDIIAQAEAAKKDQEARE